MANNNKKNQPSGGMMPLLTALIVFLMIACVAVGLIGYYSAGFSDWSKFEQPAKEQQTPDEQPDPDEETPLPDDGDGVIVDGDGEQLEPGKIYPMSNMLFATTAAEQDEQITIEATFTPAGVTNQKVDWSVSFVNPSSSWANGKTATDYVTVTATADGATTAKVACKEAFGEQIKITVTSREDSSVTNSVTVDFAKRVVSAEIKLTKGGSAASVIDFSSAGIDYALSVVPTYGVGTVEDEFDMTMTWKGTDALLNAIKGSGSYTAATLSDTTFKTNYAFFDKLYGFDKVGTSALKNDLTDALKAFSGNVIEVSVSYVGEYSDFSTSKAFAKGNVGFDIYPEGITIGGGTIIF